MNDYYFIFNGINSKDMGLEIIQFPEIIKPERNIQTINIPGRSNNLYIDQKTYNNYTLSITCCINTLKNKKNIDKITSWLNGFGDLIISQEKDKIYNACIKNSISISDVIWLFPKFTIIFEVQPLKKSINFKNEYIEINKKTIINNIGTVESLPVITIYGAGDVNLKINDNTFVIKNIDEYITINSDFLEVYKDNVNQNNKYNNFDFPKLNIGKNIIDFTGNVNKLEIIPNWRWL
ncbi:distal tail protein Dit [[Clostridium] colinum]|uniref:distal tail protein Dit n=1 Tax=[Clostridium] colinum TaxID=36835 RepID=UPI0020246E34|nr:distal tail protein Dit [[Clostridium] colinum]